MLRRYLILVGIVILALFLPVALIAPLRNGAVSSVRPVASLLTNSNQSIRNFWLNIAHLGDLRGQKDDLQKQVIALEQKVVDTEDLARENETLRKELGVTGVAHDLPKVLGHVLIQGGSVLDYTFTVDVGQVQGVKVGQAVVSSGVLVGRVIEVRSQTAVVRSITSLSSGIQAELAASQEKGYLTGTGNGVELGEITQGVAVSTSDIVQTSGLGGTMPRGILIGTISNKKSSESEGTQRFQVTIPIDPLSVQQVFVLIADSQ